MSLCIYLKEDSYEKRNIFALMGNWKLIEFVNGDDKTGTWEYKCAKNPNGYFTHIISGIVNFFISALTVVRIFEDSAKKYNIH